MHSLRRFLLALATSVVLQGTSAAASSAEVRAALADLTVVNIDSVRGNLHLPTEATGGYQVTWKSSNESIISNDGLVQRQSDAVDVVLTALIDHEGTQEKRQFTASVREAAKLDPFQGYAFAYFTGNSRAGENIFLAASNGNNALSWKELNGGQPILTSSQGTKGLRDPFLIRSPEGDTFYLIATDLSIGSGTSWGDAVKWGSRYLEVWQSNDLKTWSAQRHVLVSPQEAGNTWAPEAYYDTELGAYVVYWASSIYASNDPNRTRPTYHRMLYATTRDFVTFSKTSVWQDAGMSRIDSTVLKSGDTYYRFTKDEGASGTGCSDIIQERSKSLRATLSSWTTIASCIGRNAGTSAVEGPTAFRANQGDVNGDKFYLFVDEYGGRGYIPLETADIGNPKWAVSKSYQLPKSPRHGTVVPVTAKELAGLTGAAKRSEDVQKAPAVRGKRFENSKSVQRAAQGSPVLPGLYADPNIAAFGRNYYIYATTDGFPGWRGQVFYTWKSQDLVTWTRAEKPFLTLNGTSGNVPWAVGNAWAPTIISKNGKYYFYFSGHNAEYNRKTIGAAVASSPEGPFTAQPKAMILNNEAVTSKQAIDPQAFRDPQTGIYWMLWGNGSPVIAQLSDDLLSIKQDTIKAMTGLTDYREGSFLVYRKGVYHLTYSIDDTRSENYRVGYATASSINGPWTYRGVVLQKDPSQGILGTGHNSILNVPGTDSWYIAYHRFAIPNGNGTSRETTIDRLTFDSQTGLIQPVKPTLSSVGPHPICY